MRFRGKDVQDRDPRGGDSQSGGPQQGWRIGLMPSGHSLQYPRYLEPVKKNGTRCRSGAGGSRRRRGVGRLREPGTETGPESRSGPLEPAARSHRKHRRRPAAVHDAEVAIASVMVSAMPAGVRPEEEPAEEDDRDDEDDAGNDADPRGHRGEPVAAWLTVVRYIGGRRPGSGRHRSHRSGCRFVGGRRWFAHMSQDVKAFNALRVNNL